MQVAIRLPETGFAQARKIAERKGIGYQTFLKMLVREGLLREARRGLNWRKRPVWSDSARDLSPGGDIEETKSDGS